MLISEVPTRETKENEGALTTSTKRVIVSQANAIIEKFFSQAMDTNNSEVAKRCRESAYDIVDELLEENENTVVSGDADDFHNLSVRFSRQDDNETALEIVKKGLTIHKANTDLLADAIRYGNSCGDFENCDAYYQRLNKISKRRWTWRAYSFIIDYLIDSLDRYEEISDEVFDEKKEQILNLVNKYKGQFGDMEDSWYSEFDVYWNLNERDKAKTILEEISKKDMKCPKSWLRYADILMDDGNLDKAESLLKRLKQDDFDSSYSYYLDGRYRFGKLLGQPDCLRNKEDEEIQTAIQEAYRSFAMAWRLNANPGLKEKIRSTVKRLFFESETKPLKQYRVSDYGISFDEFD